MTSNTTVEGFQIYNVFNCSNFFFRASMSLNCIFYVCELLFAASLLTGSHLKWRSASFADPPGMRKLLL